MRRLLLDTTILIHADRTSEETGLGIAEDDDLAIAAVSAAEFLEGVERADTPQRRARRQGVFNRFMAVVAVEDYTLETARAHAALLAFTRSSGQPRGPHDLIVAATAVQTGRLLVSSDARARYGGLPGVAAIGETDSHDR